MRSLTFSYNATVHETTGFAPFQLMFGRTPRLPVDLLFGSVLQNDQAVDYDTYVQSLMRDLAEAMRVAQVSAAKQQRRQADLYNGRVKGASVEVGDRVLLANKGERGKRKLADRWENRIYTVVEKHDNTHTFKIRNSAGDQEKVVHRNLIMPVNFLPILSESGGSCVSDLSSSGSLLGDDFVDFVVLPDCEPENRTVSWVSRLPASSGDQVSISPGAAALDVVDEAVGYQDESVSCDLPANVDCSSDLTDTKTVAPVPLHDSRPVEEGSIVRLKPEGTLFNAALGNSQGRTRYGRVVRPVVRLIQHMQQKVLAGL